MFKKNSQKTPAKRQRSEKTPLRSKNYSYYESRSGGDNKERIRSEDREQIERASLIKRRPWYQRVLNTVILLLILAFAAYDLVLSTTPKLVIAGNTNTTKLFSVSRAKYQLAADNLFTQSIFTRSKITIDTNALALKLEKEFPELSSVSISLPLIGSNPVVTVVPAQPALIVTSQSQPGSFLVDTDGRVLANTANAWPKNTLPKIIDQTGINYIVGQTTMSPSDISFIELVSSQFVAKGISITSMTLSAQSRELDVYISGVSYFVKFNLQDNNEASQQIGTYLATKQYLMNNHITPTNYIDAMVAGRVYYK